MSQESSTTTGPGGLNADAPEFQRPQVEPARSAEQMMEEIARRVVSESLQTNHINELVDETISDTSNLSDLDKTPDIVKAVRDFDGNPTEYTSWRKSVDRIFNLYGGLRGTAKYYGILTVIRSKVIGQANTALESYNTPLNWLAIKQCLNTHYADKRDISTLEYQLTTLVQGRNSIEYFYQQVYSNFSLILNNISGMGLNKHTEDTLIETYRNKALDTFIRGLNGDLPKLLAIREPKTLPEALYVCTKLANQDFRTNYAYNNQHTMTPTLPQRNSINQYNTQRQRTVPPQATNLNLNRGQIQNLPRSQQPIQQHAQPMHYMPRQYNTTQPQQQNVTNQPMQQYPQYSQYRAMSQQTQKPTTSQPTGQTDTQPPPEPMEVDRSIRSQQIDYGNKPRQQQIATKRPLSAQFTNQHQKQQRNFHIYTNESNNAGTFDIEEENEEQHYEMPWEQYLEEHDQHEGATSNNPTDVSEIHFLE